MKDLEKYAKAYALKNAVSYKGKANMGAVIASLFNEGLKKSEVKTVSKEVKIIVDKVNNLSLKEQQKEYENYKDIISERPKREGLENLPKVPKKGVIMRFAPAPSAPLHIGHALTASLSYLYVKKYGGTLYLRIEDTNPDTIEKQFYTMVEEDGEWLFNNEAKVIIQSERMELYYTYTKTLLEKKAAYVCTCSQEHFKTLLETKQDCPCRDLKKEEQLKRWQQMLDKNGYKTGEAVVRFKAGMTQNNPAMRDFPLARINETPHPLQKKTYRVWPLMNLSVTVDDIELGMTHIIRAKDQQDNAKKQQMIFETLKKPFPWTAFLGKIKFKDIVLSKRVMKEEVEKGTYTGWDDPQLPTLLSLRKQGYTPEAFWRFAERIGLSQNDKVMDKKEFFTLLDAFNKDT